MEQRFSSGRPYHLQYTRQKQQTQDLVRHESISSTFSVRDVSENYLVLVFPFSIIQVDGLSNRHGRVVQIRGGHDVPQEVPRAPPFRP